MRQAQKKKVDTFIVTVYRERVHWSTRLTTYLLKDTTLGKAKGHCQKAETAGLKVTLVRGEDSSTWFDV